MSLGKVGGELDCYNSVEEQEEKKLNNMVVT
jgi:hypothetical protein